MVQHTLLVCAFLAMFSKAPLYVKDMLFMLDPAMGETIKGRLEYSMQLV